MSVLEQIEHKQRCLPPLFVDNGAGSEAKAIVRIVDNSAQAAGTAPLFALQAQISEHKAKAAARSCLDQLVGLVYHPDSDSLAVIEKLYADAREAVLPHSAKHIAVENDAKPAVDPTKFVRNEISLQIQHDRQALAHRNDADNIVDCIAENGVLFIKGRAGLAITLGIYALNHIRPADSAPKMVLGAGEGMVEGVLFRGAAHVADKAAQHAGTVIARYTNESLRPQLLIRPFTDAIKTWKLPVTHDVLVGHKAGTVLLPEVTIHHAPHVVANPDEVFSVVSHMTEHLPPARAAGPLFIAEHNAEFGNADKALLYRQSYQLMFSRAHLIFLEEVDPEFCRAAAKNIHYRWCASRVNSRGQGLGFLLHPRLKIVGEPVNLEPVANVYHFHELRPGFMVHLKDTRTGAQFDAVAVHLKSMCGGPYTHGVRYAQAKELVKLVSDHPTILGGDWNFFLNRTEREMTPLSAAGFQLIDPASAVATQECGGRLDGFMIRNTPWAFDDCETFNFWHDLPHHSFSDHALLRARINVPVHQRKNLLW